MPRKNFNELRKTMAPARQKRNTKAAKTMLADTYAGLVQLLPPRPLHDQTDYDQAVEMIGHLAGYDLNNDQADYIDALATFVEKYESEHDETKVSTSHVKGIDILRHLMQEHDLSGADLSRLLNVSRSLGQMILRGERQLTAEHARILGSRFKLDPGAFIRG